MIASKPEKLYLIVDKYIKHIVSLKLKNITLYQHFSYLLQLKNESYLSYEHLYILGNLFHFIPSTYLNLVDERAFKFMVETGLFDTRICIDSISNGKWSDLIIRAFG